MADVSPIPEGFRTVTPHLIVSDGGTATHVKDVTPEEMDAAMKQFFGG